MIIIIVLLVLLLIYAWAIHPSFPKRDITPTGQ